MKLSTVIPYYNECGPIRAIVDVVRATPMTGEEILQAASLRFTGDRTT